MDPWETLTLAAEFVAVEKLTLRWEDMIQVTEFQTEVIAIILFM